MQRIGTAKGGTYEITGWCDLIETDTARPWALYMDRFYADVPAVTRNTFGEGRVYYVGTIRKKTFYQTLLTEIFRAQDIPLMETLPQGVEITTRSNETDTYRFLFNNTMHAKTIVLPGEKIHLQPPEMKILTGKKGG